MVCSNYLIYILVGYLIDNNEVEKKIRIIIYVLGILGLFAHIIGTYVLSINANSIIQTYKGYTNVPCILYSTSIFVFAKQIFKKVKINKIISKISNYTFAIYLIHWYILDTMRSLFEINAKSIIYRLGAPFIIIPICILITWCTRKIPIVKKILP